MSAKLNDAALLGLAPLSLESYRVARYRADEQAVSLADLPKADRRAVVDLYAMLSDLLQLVRERGENPEPEIGRDLLLQPGVEAVAQRHGLPTLIGALQRMGRDVEPGSRLADIVHDVRGGALSALSMELYRVQRGWTPNEAWRSLFILARDHAKVMRNVVYDLDGAARARDLERISHGTRDLALALGEFSADIGGQQVKVEVDCRANVTIAESCVEFGAVDRIVYNLLNNAVRHASEAGLSAYILPLTSNLRIVLANAISEEQEAALANVLESGALPAGYSTTGSGVGLRIVTHLVGSAYGIAKTSEVTAAGYAGTTILSGLFVSWFHWPIGGA